MIPHIARRSFGDGPRPVLAIHCTMGRAGAWRGLAAVMGDAVTFHAFDLPGHGRSGDWDGQGDLHDCATAMARAVLDDLGPGAVDVIGHSFGGTVALRLAAEAPDRIRSAALFEPVFFAPAIADSPDYAARHMRSDTDYEAAYAAGDPERATQVFNDYWGGGLPWDELPDETRQYMTKRIGFVHHSTPALIHDRAGLMAPGGLDAVQVPVLMMRGETSPWAAEVNGAIARRLRNVREVALPAVGHLAPITHPKALDLHLRSFFELPARSRPIAAD